MSSDNCTIRATSDSIIVESNGEYLAEYASPSPKRDAVRMRRVLQRHLAEGGTLLNYQW